MPPDPDVTEEWVPVQIVVNRTYPWLDMVCVDDADAPTQELRLRLPFGSETIISKRTL